MGGVDQGLRIGGRCTHKASGKKGIILGLPKEASITAKVQWDEVNSTIRYADGNHDSFSEIKGKMTMK